MCKQLIGTSLMLSASLVFLLAGSNASFARPASYAKCDDFLNTCYRHCANDYEGDVAKARCGDRCFERYNACYAYVRKVSGFPVNPNPPPKWTDPGRVKSPPLKGTDNPPKRTAGPVRVKPPIAVSNPGGAPNNGGPRHGGNPR
jgi:hypothetical protein